MQQIRIPIKATADTGGAEAAMGTMESAAAGVEKAVAGIGDAADKAGRAIDGAAKKAGELGNAVEKAGAGKLEGTATAATAAAGAINKIADASRNAGKSVDDLGRKSDSAIRGAEYNAERLRRVQELLAREFGSDISVVDAQRAALNYEKIRGGRGLGSRSFRRSNDFVDWLETSRLSAQNGPARRHRLELVAATMSGTNFAEKNPEQVQPPPEPDENDEFGRHVKKAQSYAMSFGKGMLALAGIQGAMSMAGSAVDMATEEAVGADTLKRRMGDLGQDFETLRRNVRGATDGLGITYVESIRLAQQFAKTAGNFRGNVGDQVHVAGGMARAFGIDPTAGVEFFATMQRLGMTRGADDNRRLALMIGEAVTKSGYGAKADEVLAAVSNFATQAARLSLVAPNVADYTSYLTGAMKTGYIGLDPAGAAAMLGSADTAVRRGGGMGEAGLNFTYAALSQAHPGTDVITAMGLAEGGIFGTTRQMFSKGTPLGDWYRARGLGVPELNDTTNLTSIRALLDKQYGMNSPIRLDAIKNYFGLNSYAQAAAFDMLKPTEITQSNRLLTAGGFDLSKMNATAIQDVARVSGAGSIGDLEKLRQELSKRTDIPAAEQDAMRQAVQDGDLEKAKQTFATTLARHGQEQTEGTQTRQSIADLKDVLTTIGGELLKPLTDIRDIVVGMARIVEGGPSGAVQAALSGTAIGGKASDASLGVSPILKNDKKGRPLEGDKKQAVLKFLRETDKLLGLPLGTSERQIMAESSFIPTAVNDKTKAMGLAQVMPGTLADLNRRLHSNLDPSNPMDAALIQRMVLQDKLRAEHGNIGEALKDYVGAKTTRNDAATQKYVADILGPDWQKKRTGAETVANYLDHSGSAKASGTGTASAGTDPVTSPDWQKAERNAADVNAKIGFSPAEVQVIVKDQSGNIIGTGSAKPFVSGAPAGGVNPSTSVMVQ